MAVIDNNKKTKYILENYRAIKWSVTVGVEQLRSYLPSSSEGNDLGDMVVNYEHEIDQFIIKADAAGINLDNTDLHHQIEIIRKNKLILTYIDRAINIIKNHHIHGNIYYLVLHSHYLSNQCSFNVSEEGIRDLKEKLNIEIGQAQYFRYLNESIRLLSDIIWGYSDSVLNIMNDFYFHAIEKRD